MAPLPESSLVATLSKHLNTILQRASGSTHDSPLSKLQNQTSPANDSSSSSLFSHGFSLLHARTTSSGIPNPGFGVTPPNAIPNKAVFGLFGLIGVGFVLTGIWFFFWAKNGGFYFKQDDWDDYKSTVLRRKGPNGTTLSGATESTDLGGGSVVHEMSEAGTEYEGRSVWGRKKKNNKRKQQQKQERYKDFDEETAYTGTTISTEAEIAELKAAAKAQKKFKKESGKKYKKAPASTVATSEMGTAYEDDGEMDVGDGVKSTIRAYRHEKPAKVGGLNTESEASAWDGSTQDGMSSAASDLLSHREKTPTNTPTKLKSRKDKNDALHGGASKGIRKVVSTSEGTSFWKKSSNTTTTSNNQPESPSARKALLDRDQEDFDEQQRIRAEARKLQEKGRAAQRSHRDFSFNAGDDMSSAASDREREREARREERERRRRQHSPSPTKKIPGSYGEGSDVSSNVSSDVGTKSYHHPIPGLSSTGGTSVIDYAEEKRKKRAGGGETGYRRGRGDSLE